MSLSTSEMHIKVYGVIFFTEWTFDDFSKRNKENVQKALKSNESPHFTVFYGVSSVVEQN